MARESKSVRAERAAEVYDLLAGEYPDAHCELDFESPFQLAVATILSAQTTDERVNSVTPGLFARYPDAAALASADQRDVEEIIRSTGFFRSKAKNIIGFARGLMAEHGGDVPADLAHLAALPGVGRKTANVILGNAFDRAEGVVVDTHVKRLVKRFGITGETDPTKIERILMEVVPREEWTDFAHRVVLHGRKYCTARKPNCEQCPCLPHCPQVGV